MHYSVKVQINYNGDDAMLYSMLQSYMHALQESGIEMGELLIYKIND